MLWKGEQKKDLNLQIHLHKAFFSTDQLLDSVHKSFLNQTTLNLRKEKWSFLNREFTEQHLQQLQLEKNFAVLLNTLQSDISSHE